MVLLEVVVTVATVLMPPEGTITIAISLDSMSSCCKIHAPAAMSL